MNQALWDELTRQFPAGATDGTLDPSSLPNGSAAQTLLADYGIAAPLSLSGGAWTQAANGDFELSTTVASELLGLAAPVTASFTFLAAGSDADPNPLVVVATLKSGWTMGAAFVALAGTLTDTLSASSGTLTLASSASTSAAQGLTANFVATSSAPAVRLLFDVLDGADSISLSGPVAYLQPGTVTSGVSFALVAENASKSLELSPNAALDLSFGFWGGLDATSTYVSGLQCTATVPYAGQSGSTNEVGLSGLLQGKVASTVEISLAGGPLDFPSSDTIENLFGGIDLASSIPADAPTSGLQVRSFSVGVSLSPLGLAYCSLAIGTPEGYVHPLFGDLSFSDVLLVGTVTDPTGDLGWSLQLQGVVGVGSLQIAAYGALPAEEFGGSLAATTDHDVPTILSSLGLETVPPQLDGLQIDALDFSANVAESAYALDFSVSDSWRFAVGTDATIEVTGLELSFASDADGTSLKIAGGLEFDTARFSVELDTGTSATLLKGWWSDPSAPIDYIDLAIALGIYGLPSLPADIDIALTAASFELDLSSDTFTFTLTTAGGSEAVLVVGKTTAGWGYLYGAVLGTTLSIDLTDVPVLSELVPEGGDVLSISAMRMEGGSKVLPAYDPELVSPILGPQISSGLALSADFSIGADDVTLLAQFGGYDDQSGADVPPTPTPAPSPPAASGAGVAEAADPQDPTGDRQTSDASTPAAPSITWQNVQRKFGPLQVDRIGYGLSGGASATVLVDGGISLGGFSLELSGLSATIPLQSPYVPGFSLQGLSVAYSAPPLTVSGSLQVVDAQTFAGTLAVATDTFGLSVLCSYTTGARPSLFAYAALDMPLGGPPCFFVEGLAGGFGYNEALPTITIDDVATTPFVEAALGKPVTVAQIRSILDPQPNQNWAAAGVVFSSFEIVQTFALLTVSFGTELQVGLLGLSTLSMPPAVEGEAPVTPIAQVQMALDVSVQPALGQFSANAMLTPASYVLSRDAQLTGGFAFYVWFGPSPHAGEFVVTLGGYSSYFEPPSYYPAAAPVGVNWAVSPGMQVKGGIYFALTPALGMAGGSLQATWQSPSVTACFDAQADFLIRFQPFQYALDVSVTVSLALQLDLLLTTKTIHVQLGVDLQLWGPEFGGTARIDLSVATFSLSFGSDGPDTDGADLSWSSFRQALLPPEPSASATAAPASPRSIDDDPAPVATTSVLITCDVASGLVARQGGAATVLPTATFVLTTQVPSKTLTVDGTAIDVGSFNGEFGIGPMGVDPADLQVELIVSTTADVAPFWSTEPRSAVLPAGVWLNTAAALDAPATVANVLTQVFLSPTAKEPTNPPLDVQTQQLQASGDYPVVTVQWSDATAPSTDGFGSEDPMAELEATLADPDVAAARSAILAGLRRQGLSTASSVDLSGFVSDAPYELDAPPLLRLLGETR